MAKVYLRTPVGWTNREKATYEHLATLTTKHPGRHNIRQALDVFDIVRSNGDVHVCLVHPPLQSTLFAFQRLGSTPRALPEELAKIAMKGLLEALDFLHTEAHVTHCGTENRIDCPLEITNVSPTDLKLSNIMLRVEDEGIFADYEREETLAPSVRKVITEERTIYASRPFRRPRAHAYGVPVLCDFGEARIGAPNAYAEIQPEIYKSPEILMQFEWGHAADIWNAACVVSQLFPFRILFNSLLSAHSCGKC